MVVKKNLKNEKFLLVTQVGSPIGRDKSHRQTLIGLGLNKIGRSSKLPENSSVNGMVNKVKYLLKIEHIG